MPLLGTSSDGPSSGANANAGVVLVTYMSKRERIYVKSANSPLKEVLVEACEKFDLGNADRYGLKHRGKNVDLSLPYRWAGLNNNANLELEFQQTSSSSSSSSLGKPQNQETTAVHIQIRIDNGMQHRGKYAPSTSLETILKEATSDEVIRVVYMQQRIEQESFSGTTLSSLGLNAGSGALRAFVKKIKESPKPVAVVPPKSPVMAGVDPMEVEKPEKVEKKPAMKKRKRSFSELIPKIRSAHFDQDCRTIALTLLKILTTIVNRPGDSRVRQMKLSNEKFYEKVGRFPEAVEVMVAAGFVQTEDERLVLDIEREDTSVLKECISELAKFGLDVGLAQFEISQLTDPPSRSSSQDDESEKAEPIQFDPYKSNVVRVAPQPRGGASAIETELQGLQAKYDRIMDEAGIPERKVKIFRPEKKFNPRQFTAAQQQLEDDSGERGDLKMLAEAMKETLKKQEQKQQFRTKAMRDLETLKKTRVFTKTLIRVQFPDRTLVQAYFSPKETIASVIKVLDEYLHESIPRDEPSFYLYSTPPMVKHDKTDATMLELGLIPAALVYIGFATTYDQYLNEKGHSLMATSHQDQQLENDAMDIEVPTSVPLSEQQQQQQEEKQRASATQSSSSSSSAAKRSKGGAPKWFKLYK